jgi:hypothetical protein
MKNTHRQKITSTIAVTLMATGLSGLSPTLTLAMGCSGLRRRDLGGAGIGGAATARNPVGREDG